jgi:HTH-type transcriptional regulator/antitoxin HigA
MKNDVKPIRTRKDYEAALKEAERMWGARTGTPDGDRLDVLATLIDAYEAAQFPIDPPDPDRGDQIPHGAARPEAQGSRATIGTRTRVAEVLNRRRNLSIAMIRRLHQRLGISAEVLIRPTRKQRAA